MRRTTIGPMGAAVVGLVVCSAVVTVQVIDPHGELSIDAVPIPSESSAPVLVPVEPFRVHDSRLGGGPIDSGENRLISVASRIDLVSGDVVAPDAVPAGAIAILFNLTVVGTAGAGFLTVAPGNVTAVGSASANWTGSGQTLNNGTFTEVDADRMVRVFAGGPSGSSTNFTIDVTGYLLPPE